MSEDQLVLFVTNKLRSDGVIAASRINGCVAFPHRDGNQPEAHEVWQVRIVTDGRGRMRSSVVALECIKRLPGFVLTDDHGSSRLDPVLLPDGKTALAVRDYRIWTEERRQHGPIAAPPAIESLIRATVNCAQISGDTPQPIESVITTKREVWFVFDRHGANPADNRMLIVGLNSYAQSDHIFTADWCGSWDTTTTQPACPKGVPSEVYAAILDKVVPKEIREKWKPKLDMTRYSVNDIHGSRILGPVLFPDGAPAVAGRDYTNWDGKLQRHGVWSYTKGGIESHLQLWFLVLHGQTYRKRFVSLNATAGSGGVAEYDWCGPAENISSQPPRPQGVPEPVYRAILAALEECKTPQLPAGTCLRPRK